MEPKDLKNSNDELNAVPETQGTADVPNENLNVQAEELESAVSEPSEDAVVVEASEVEKVVEPTSDEVLDQSVDVEEEVKETAVVEAEVVAEVSEEENVVESVEVETPEQNADAEVKTEVAPAVENEVVAESGELKVVPEKVDFDYASMTEVELINALRALLEKTTTENIKDEIDQIKINFYKKHRANVEEEKKKFIEGGGVEEEFKTDNAPYEEDLKNLLKDYRNMRSSRMKSQESEKEENLRIKYQIIDEIKGLVNRKESINKTFNEFRDLQQTWRDTGLVPQAKLKDLWETYHHHVENFYDYIKINKELRDLDLKKNMEIKIGLCERAEELLVEPSVIKAFNILQKFHEQWREIGPVPREKKEEIWERFKAATSKINKKHQEYFEGRKVDQKKNLEAKSALCDKVEEIAALVIESNKDWESKSKELIELQKVWRTIGFAPKKDNNRIYERFRVACDQFFDRKREFYSQNKEIQMNNLQVKTDLCVQAESLKDSTDWKKATDEFIRIQRKWKEIGPVPRKHSDVIWKRFRAACDFFFENKSNHFSHVDEEQVDNLKLKQELIEQVQAYELTKDDGKDLDQMKEFQRKFNDIGHVPYKEKDVIMNQFRDAINIHFDNLKIDNKERSMLKFKNKIAHISGSSRGYNKMRFERDKYVSKLKQYETDLGLLNNNIGFFANTKNAEALIGDVNKKIADMKEQIKLLKDKIRIIDDMDEME